MDITIPVEQTAMFIETILIIDIRKSFIETHINGKKSQRVFGRFRKQHGLTGDLQEAQNSPQLRLLIPLEEKRITRNRL